VRDLGPEGQRTAHASNMSGNERASRTVVPSRHPAYGQVSLRGCWAGPVLTMEGESTKGAVLCCGAAGSRCEAWTRCLAEVRRASPGSWCCGARRASDKTRCWGMRKRRSRIPVARAGRPIRRWSCRSRRCKLCGRLLSGWDGCRPSSAMRSAWCLGILRRRQVVYGRHGTVLGLLSEVAADRAAAGPGRCAKWLDQRPAQAWVRWPPAETQNRSAAVRHP